MSWDPPFSASFVSLAVDAHVLLSLVQDESQDECRGVVGDRGDAHHRVRLSECESCLGDQESGVFFS